MGTRITSRSVVKLILVVGISTFGMFRTAIADIDTSALKACVEKHFAEERQKQNAAADNVLRKCAGKLNSMLANIPVEYRGVARDLIRTEIRKMAQGDREP